MCTPRPIEVQRDRVTASTSWNNVASIELSPGHTRVSAEVQVTDAATVRLVGPMDGPFWAPSATSGAATLATTIDAGVPRYVLQVRATSGTVTVTARLYAR